jgi:hypothetical protein
VVDSGHWDSTGIKLDPVNAVGFVYVIVEKETHRKYIGKKNFKGIGKLNKGSDSNWRTYSSSSKYVQELIREKGLQEFSFVILDQYFTTGGLSFAETWTQIVCETPSRNDEFFNRFIDKVTWKVTEPVTILHRLKLEEVLSCYSYPKICT